MKIELRGPRLPSYSLLVMGEHERALKTAEQLLAEDAKLLQVFFYAEAVKLAQPAAQMMAIRERWLALQQRYGLALWLCHDAAQDWGVIAEGGRKTVEPGFMLGTLGQFAEGCYRSDYLLSFGVQDAS